MTGPSEEVPYLETVSVAACSNRDIAKLSALDIKARQPSGSSAAPPGKAVAPSWEKLSVLEDCEQGRASHERSSCAAGFQRSSAVTMVAVNPSVVDRHDATHEAHYHVHKHTDDGKRQMIINLWMLFGMAGVIAIICVANARLKEGHAGEGWHSITHDIPFAIALNGDPSYVQGEMLLPPWENQVLGPGPGDVLLEHAHQGSRRSLKRSLQETLVQAQMKQLLSSSPVDPQWVETPPPKLLAFVGQQLSAASGNFTWTMLTDYSDCIFEQASSQTCFVEFKDVKRINSSLPAVFVVQLEEHVTELRVVTAFIEVTQMGGFGLVKEWIALMVIALVLIALALEVMHRMWIAFIGGFLMSGLLLIANLAPDLEKVVGWIDAGTMALLFGMMVIVGQLQKTGVFEVVCACCLKLSRGRILFLTIVLGIMTAFASAWLDNVTTMLLVAPMTIAVFKVLDRDPVPLLITQALLSNIGGIATMVGDPPNIIIGNVLAAYLGFIDFIVNLGPGVLVIFPFGLLVPVLLYRKDLTGRIDNMEEVNSVTQKYVIKDWRLFWMSTYITCTVILAFLLQPIHGLNPGWIALIGATMLVIAAEPHDAHEVLHTVEWDMLLFFAGMFIMVEGAVELGLMRKIAALIKLIIGTAPVSAQKIAAMEVILWFSAIFSAVLDNIPYTIAMLPVIKQLAYDSPELDLLTLTWALSFGACLGGNGSLIGASANIVTAGIAGREGHNISFMGWLYAGVPTTIVTVAVANVYLLLRYCL